METRMVMTALQMLGSLVMMVVCTFYSVEMKRYGGSKSAAIFLITNVAHLMAQVPGLLLLLYYHCS